VSPALISSESKPPAITTDPAGHVALICVVSPTGRNVATPGTSTIFETSRPGARFSVETGSAPLASSTGICPPTGAVEAVWPWSFPALFAYSAIGTAPRTAFAAAWPSGVAPSTDTVRASADRTRGRRLDTDPPFAAGEPTRSLTGVRLTPRPARRALVEER